MRSGWQRTIKDVVIIHAIGLAKNQLRLLERHRATVLSSVSPLLCGYFATVEKMASDYRDTAIAVLTGLPKSGPYTNPLTNCLLAKPELL
jgi:4-hydroxy-3-methylbut-2-enyl diphosphate reductase IspH